MKPSHHNPAHFWGMLIMLLASATTLSSCRPTASDASPDAKLQATELVKQAERKYLAKDYDGAIADNTKALEIDPKNSSAYYNRGVAKVGKKDYDGAIADYTKALELDPKKVNAYYNRGVAKVRKKDYDGAIADYTKALELEPKDADAYVLRGIAKRNNKDYDSAITDYTKALEVDPKNAAAYVERGIVKDITKDYDGAIADSTKALELDSKKAHAYSTRSLCYYRLGNFDRAMVDAKEAATADSEFAYHHFLVWALHVKRGEMPAATAGMQAFHKQQGADPKAEAWPLKISAFLAGNTSESDFLASAASENKNTENDQRCEAYFYAGMVRLAAGDKQGAAAQFQKCLATGQETFIEYDMAEKELSDLQR